VKSPSEFVIHRGAKWPWCEGEHMQLHGKRIVITGAASGIGREILRQIAYYDAEVVAADRDAERLGEAVRAPDNARASLNPFVCDLSSQAGTDELVAHALAALGGIDIFIANAGFAYYERLGLADWNHIQSIYCVNTFSPIYAVLKMAEINPDNAYMTVITASTMGHWGLPGYALYSSTKGALHLFAESYRAELPPNGKLMMVYPVGTKTRFFEETQAPVIPPTQDVETVASAIIRGIQRDASSVYPSWIWKLSSFVDRFVPIIKPITQRIYRRAFYDWEQVQR
jgi:short-subunit dehydrogenase